MTFRDRLRCFLRGHDATYGTLFGWCERCQHTVHTYDRKSVLYYGEYHRFPPAHRVLDDPTIVVPNDGVPPTAAGGLD